MRILQVSNVNLKNNVQVKSKNIDITPKVDIIEQKKQKGKNNKNISAQVALGLVALSSVWMLVRTDKTRIQKIVAEEKKDIKSRFRSGSFEVEIYNFKNDKNVKSLDELSGLENVKEFIDNYQLLLENPTVKHEHNVQDFSSILFWGVPGTGKTSAAKGIAKKLNADYIQIDKEFFDSMFVSEAPKILTKMFEQIEQHAKSYPQKRIIVFMDEIDGSISINRGSTSNHTEDITNTLKKSITYLQEECDNIIFIGATNKDPSGIKSDNSTVRLNPAVLSRFKYQMEIGLPNKNAICDAWGKLMKTSSGKDKFTSEQNEVIAQHFYDFGLSFREVKNIADKLNKEDAVEFCKKSSYNSKDNLITVLTSDEKIGYDAVKKQRLPQSKIDELIESLNNKLN